MAVSQFWVGSETGSVTCFILGLISVAGRHHVSTMNFWGIWVGNVWGTEGMCSMIILPFRFGTSRSSDRIFVNEREVQTSEISGKGPMDVQVPVPQ